MEDPSADLRQQLRGCDCGHAGGRGLAVHFGRTACGADPGLWHSHVDGATRDAGRVCAGGSAADMARRQGLEMSCRSALAGCRDGVRGGLLAGVSAHNVCYRPRRPPAGHCLGCADLYDVGGSGAAAVLGSRGANRHPAHRALPTGYQSITADHSVVHAGRLFSGGRRRFGAPGAGIQRACGPVPRRTGHSHRSGLRILHFLHGGFGSDHPGTGRAAHARAHRSAL